MESSPSENRVAAVAAGLRYVSDRSPGIERRRRGRSFAYIGSNGKRITDDSEIARIKKLAIPPAYENVWICPSPAGHIQATGRDARGRKQYRYHARWREVRDETKFDRMLAFAEVLPAIRRRVAADLQLTGLPRDKALAVIVRLLETSSIRIGNEEYARSNKSFGLTTMHNDHVDISGATMRFEFRGKSGKRHSITVRDRKVANIVRRMADLPGQHLFTYQDDDGSVQTIDSSDVNGYIQAVAGQEFTAKDFRTWLGTLVCTEELAGAETAPNQTGRQAIVKGALDRVAQRLGNTPAVCRKSYVHPLILETYIERGALSRKPSAVSKNGETAALSAAEKSLVRFLSRKPPKRS